MPPRSMAAFRKASRHARFSKYAKPAMPMPSDRTNRTSAAAAWRSSRTTNAARGIGCADVDPDLERAGEVAHRERRFLRCGDAARKADAFGVFQAIGEHAREQVLPALGRVARDLERERRVGAAVDVGELDREV